VVRDGKAALGLARIDLPFGYARRLGDAIAATGVAFPVVDYGPGGASLPLQRPVHCPWIRAIAFGICGGELLVAVEVNRQGA
jgi:hypothetical protein